MGWIHAGGGAYSPDLPSEPDPKLIEEEAEWKKAVDEAKKSFFEDNIQDKSWDLIFQENPGFIEDWLSTRTGKTQSPESLNQWNEDVLLTEFMRFKRVPIPEYGDYVTSVIDF